jgi:hypothetical protein
VTDYSYDAAGNIDHVDYTIGGQTQTLLSNMAYSPFGPMTCNQRGQNYLMQHDSSNQ